MKREEVVPSVRTFAIRPFRCTMRRARSVVRIHPDALTFLTPPEVFAAGDLAGGTLKGAAAALQISILAPPQGFGFKVYHPAMN
jgi:hypothetical protein